MASYPAPQVPAPLQTAVDQAAAQFGVPAGTLVGIWRIESGSSYPNPYRNSLGYGGLFGTTHWNTSTQDQANYAASILARLLQQYNGDMARALSAYSGGGYTSVPGGPTSSTPVPPDTTPSGGGSDGSQVYPSDGSAQLASFSFGGLFGGLTKGADTLLKRTSYVLVGLILIAVGLRFLIGGAAGGKMLSLGSGAGGGKGGSSSQGAVAASSEESARRRERAEELHAERVKQAKARTSQTRARARAARQRSRDEATIGAARAANKGRTAGREQAREHRAQGREAAESGVPF